MGSQLKGAGPAAAARIYRWITWPPGFLGHAKFDIALKTPDFGIHLDDVLKTTERAFATWPSLNP